MFKLIITAFLFSPLVCDVSAIPHSNINSRKGKFSIPAIRNNLTAKSDIETTQRINKDSTSELWDRNYSLLTMRQDGSSGATRSNLANPWISTVMLGSQELNLVLDTGSSDFWVFSTRQPPDQLIGHSYFDPTKSKNFLDIGNPFDVTYGGGTTVTGKTGADVAIIGVTTASSQVFGLAANVVGPSFGLDGIVGLGPMSGVSIGAKTFFDNARPLLTEALFTAYLPRTGSGAYGFGEIDDTKYSGDITYASVSTAQGHWLFQSAEYKVGDISWSDNGMAGIADTALSIILVQTATAAKYYSAVEVWEFDDMLNAYIFPCAEALPDFSFQIGPETYVTIPGSDLNAGVATSKPHMCVGGIQPTSNPYNLYGIPFFYNYYAIFDAGNQEFGFAAIS